ncbi:MAG: DUF1549 domain-containing protein, partial [Planctomycetota bacterium]
MPFEFSGRVVACAPWIAAIAFLFLGGSDATTVMASEPAAKRNAGDVPDFNKEVRTILSDKCFRCHGPDEAERYADLRFDVRESAIEDRGGSAAIVPGDVEASQLWDRINHEDDDLLMPPPDSHLSLDAKEKDILRRWIAGGAEYQKHWAFVSPTLNGDVVDHPVDHFVRKQLAAQGMAASPSADPRTLIRRLTLDLTGLPPTPQQSSAFVKLVNEKGIDLAYEQLVDQLLASHAYAERMALNWMDAARYGDTSVMHADGPRDMWPWRDWVIAAFNDNMPYDQFTVKQLAGDLLPDATVQDKIASGFNRNHATSDEGGAFPEELRVEYVVDRVQTTSTVWMGLTMQCAQCHDHKYDPISQREYYQFFAFFNNTADPGMQTRNGNQSPVVNVPDPQRDQQIADLKQLITDVRVRRTQYRAGIEGAFLQWAEQESKSAKENATEMEPPEGLVRHVAIDEPVDEELLDTLASVSWVRSGPKTKSIQRDGSPALSLNGRNQFVLQSDQQFVDADKGFSFAAWIKPRSDS